LAHGAEWVKESGFAEAKVTLRHRFLGYLAVVGAALSAPTAVAADVPATPVTTSPTVATAPNPDGGAAPRPAIWLLADEDTRIFLFGTVHILPPELKWRSAALDRVVAEADELVLEVGEDPSADEEAAIAPLVMLGKEVPILSRVSPDRRKLLGEIIRSVGVPDGALDGMQTWAAAMTITVAALAQAYAGEDGDPKALTGVEDALRADFVRTSRPISGVETGPQQMGFLASLPYRAQREMLESLVDSYRTGDPDATEPSEDDWVSGDVDRVGAEMEEMPPELFDVLITRRNTAWTGWLIERLEQPGDVLFAVGAGHLAGRDSVQSMLAERGFTVTRLD
jgi:uncharacterized protein YbaP (TraB family)